MFANINLFSKALSALCVVLFMLACISQAFGQAELTYEEYDKIEEGMTYNDVVEIVGSKGERQSHQWGKEDGSQVTVRFEDGNVVSTNYDPDYTEYEVEYSEVLEGLYDKVENDMKYQKFIGLLEKKRGNVPDAIHNTAPEFAFSYEWETPDDKNVTIKFLDGQLESKMKMSGLLTD